MPIANEWLYTPTNYVKTRSMITQTESFSQSFCETLSTEGASPGSNTPPCSSSSYNSCDPVSSLSGHRARVNVSLAYNGDREVLTVAIYQVVGMKVCSCSISKCSQH